MSSWDSAMYTIVIVCNMITVVASIATIIINASIVTIIILGRGKP